MCGRFTLFADYEELIERFQIESAFDEEEYVESYNIAPSHSVVAVIHDGKQNRMGYLRWGLVPAWAKDDKIGYKMINARAETIAEKPSFRNSFGRRRCLILADSFYEWKKDEKKKIPMRIKLKNNEAFGMAGIWDAWKKSDGSLLYTCSVITTTPNPLMMGIHDRMPVIFTKKDEKTWLNRANKDLSSLQQLLKPFDEKKMEAFEISSDVNSPKNNGPQLIQKICS
ncbi:SOS response-associated peptidase [Bacillus sp. JJ722]|uniref:SOS response-associated peptidase n=1 Tax=Bacillus sp. JJ722 TaxID=3122973 RepID=UPI002FFD97FD